MFAIAARIKKNKATNQTKFKVRCTRYLYTLVLKDSDKADKLRQSLPPGERYPGRAVLRGTPTNLLEYRPFHLRDTKEERQGQARRQVIDAEYGSVGLVAKREKRENQDGVMAHYGMSEGIAPALYSLQSSDRAQD